MAVTSISLLLLLLLCFNFSLPAHTEKPQLSRRHLALNEQDSSEEQPIPKPTTKKKTAAVSDEQPPIPKSTIKKKKAELQDSEEQPVTKKKKTELLEASEDQQPIPKSSTKKDAASIDEKNTAIKKKTLNLDSKNQTKLLLKPKKSNSTSTKTLTTPPSSPKSKLNKTLTLTPKPKSPKNSTAQKSTTSTTKKKNPNPPTPEVSSSSSIWEELSEADSDLISEFRDLPTRIHEALLPDLKKISITSKAYIYKAHKHIADNVRPIVGKSFAPKIAVAASCIFLLLPLALVTLLLYHLNSLRSLHRFLLFVQAYLAIYFLTLSLTAVATGLEPLRFFYATSPAAYAWTQAVQTLGYLLYLLVQMIHLVVVFSAGENKARDRGLGLAQMVVGLAVGCHYYAAVFHRAVAGDAPRANWRVHGVYAGCFMVILMCARAERGKKAYAAGGEDRKKS